MRPYSTLSLLLAFSTLLACQTTALSTKGVFIEPPENRSTIITFALPDHTPEEQQIQLTRSLSFWNEILDDVRLETAPYHEATVKGDYRFASSWSELKEKRKQGPCSPTKGPCPFVLLLPTDEALHGSIDEALDVAIQGPVDILLSGNGPLARQDVIAEKLIYMTLIHEIGRQLGMPLSSDEKCLMNPSLAGNKGFCEETIEAASQIKVDSFRLHR